MMFASINTFPLRPLLIRLSVLGLLLGAAPLQLQAQDEPRPGATPEEEEFFVFDEEEETQSIADPLEGLNRVTFAINDKLYRGVFKPIARGLRVLPEPVRISGRNFFTNLRAPMSSASALLQAEPKNAGTELGRFLINTTVGLLGFFDPATRLGFVRDEEDLGQTLGSYGIGHGFYLVMPFSGPSSLRDAIGGAATTTLNPVYQELQTGEMIAVSVTSAEISLSLDKDTYESLYDNALDPYIFFRSAWAQNRAGQVER